MTQRTRTPARRGSSTLEFVLVLPILLMLSFGLADYGYFFYVKHTLQGAAEAGVTPTATNSSVNAIITSKMSAAGLSSTAYTVTLSPSDVSTAASGATVSVTVSVPWGNVSFHALPVSFGGISDSKPVTGVAVMMKEPAS